MNTFGIVLALLGMTLALWAIAFRLGPIADRLDYATIGDTRIPALECQEDELITWVQAKLACAPIEYYQEVK